MSNGGPDGDETIDRILSLVRAGLSGAVRAGSWSARSVGAGIDNGVGALLERRVRNLADRRSSGAGADLASTLRAARQTPVTAQAARAALPRVTRRLAPVAAASRRSPTGMALWFGPGLYAAVASGVREFDAVTGALAARVRHAGFEPDPDRLHTAAVQVLTGSPIDPGDSPAHGRLVGSWLRAGIGSAVPFGLAGRRTEVDKIVDRCDSIDPADLGG